MVVRYISWNVLALFSLSCFPCLFVYLGCSVCVLLFVMGLFLPSFCFCCVLVFYRWLERYITFLVVCWGVISLLFAYTVIVQVLSASSGSVIVIVASYTRSSVSSIGKLIRNMGELAGCGV